MIDRKTHTSGPASGAHVRNDGEKWTLTTNPISGSPAVSSTAGWARGSEMVPFNWKRWLRQTHRWVSYAFTLGVLINFVAVLAGRYSNWIGLLAGFPLAVLTLTGLYLSVLPYTIRWRSRRRIA